MPPYRAKGRNAARRSERGACQTQKAIAPALISPRARKEWVWTMGMAPAQTPSRTNSRRSRAFAAVTSSHSAGISAIQPVSSVRWGTIMSHTTFTQRRFRSGWLVGVL